MSVETEEFEDQTEISTGIRERLAWWLHEDTGECSFCGEEIPEDTEPIRMTWRAGLLDVLVPNVGKLCSVECLACHMEVQLGVAGWAGDLLGEVDNGE